MKRLSNLFTLILCAAAVLPADVVYQVNVNTTGAAGTSGYLDFQLGRGPDSQSATVSVTNFLSSGSLNGLDLQTSGSVSGTLPAALVLGNTTQYNDYFQGFTYGSSLRFTLTFSGQAINAPNGTALSGSPFVFGLYNSGQFPLGDNDGFGNALLIQINTNGTTTPAIYNSAVSVTSAVPEPSVFSLVSGGLLLCGLVAGRRQFLSRAQ